MNLSIGLFQAYFGVYSRLSPSSAALKAIELMTSPRIKRERRQASSALLEEIVPLPGGCLAIYPRQRPKTDVAGAWVVWLGRAV